MNRFQRVQQWLTFSRRWHLLDANMQDLHSLAQKVAQHLTGAHKPIHSDHTECGDHVIVYNCGKVALRAFDWRRQSYYFDRQYAKGRASIEAWKIHQVDPCRLVHMAVYRCMSDDMMRRLYIERLHLLPDEHIPSELLHNVSSQMQQVQTTPLSYEQHQAEVVESFPQLVHPDESMTYVPPPIDQPKQ